MSGRRHALGWLLVLVVVAIVGTVWLGRGSGATSSMLSRAAWGWAGARAVLEQEHGAERVVLRDRPFTDRVARGEVLVISLPWQVPPVAGEIDALQTHLRTGGTVLVTYPRGPDAISRQLLDALDLSWHRLERPSLVPWRWWRARDDTWTLQPTAEELTSVRPVLVSVPEALPRAPDDAVVLYEGGPEALPMIFWVARQRGRVVFLPAEAWSNARLGEAGNADLLLTVAGWLDTPWHIDEYHHGLVRPTEAAQRLHAVLVRIGPIALTFWDLMVLHLLLLYGLGVWALGRRFGPVWREPRVAHASAAAFLDRLGALHDRLGHHRAAAVAMVERASALDLRLDTDGLDPERVRDGEGLLALARSLARVQHHHPRRNQP